MAGKLKPAPAATRVVVVGLKPPKGAALPEAKETERVAQLLAERVRSHKAAHIERVQVFPRFGQFSVKADQAAIELLAKQPEVECVLENDSMTP